MVICSRVADTCSWFHDWSIVSLDWYLSFVTGPSKPIWVTEFPLFAVCEAKYVGPIFDQVFYLLRVRENHD